MTESQMSYKNLRGTLLGLRNEFSIELASLLNFWSTECLDTVNGGFVGAMDHRGQADPAANKGCILNARILWTFSAAYRVTKESAHLDAAVRAYEYLKKYFWDHEYGGLYWELDHRGIPVNTKKQAYVQGFGIYGFSEFYRATGDEESLSLARELFDILEDRFWESKFGGYLEALTEDWKRIDDMRLSQKDLNAPKSMNTHLHILEPYSNLYKVWPDPRLKTAISSLLQIFCQKIYNKNTKHLDLFFGLDWKSQFHEVSFGHDIEGAWLMNEASMLINDGKVSDQVRAVSNSLIESTVKEGLDADGSLFYERHGSRLDKDKHWWPQAEAMVGFMESYELHQDLEDLNRVKNVWTFIKEFLKDKENGEWHWRVDEDNRPVPTDVKAGFWKCPYHNSRAMMELIERIDRMTQTI